MLLIKTLVRILKRLIWLILNILLLILVISKVPPPHSWAEASVFQILALFIPLLTSFTLLFHLFVKNLTFSFILALSLLILTVLQALHNFTPTTVLLTLFVTLIIILIIRNLRPRQKPATRFRNLFSKKQLR